MPRAQSTPCAHRKPGYRKRRPLCRSCAKRASITPEYRAMAAANMARGRRKHLDAMTPEQAREYRWLTNNKNLTAAEALSIVSGAN